MKKGFSALIALTMLASLVATPVGAKEISVKEAGTIAASAKPEKIVIFQNSGKVQSSGKPGSNDADYKAVKDYILKKTNIEVETIVPPAGTEKEKLNAMLASKQELDYFWGNWNEFKDIIQPLTTQLKNLGQDIYKRWPEEAFIGITDQKGEVWATPRGAPTAPYPVHLRSDWLAKYGLKYPKTIDELENVLKTFKEKDPAGNGNTIPMGCDLVGLNNALSAAFTGKGYGEFLDTDGKVKHIVLDPKYKNFISRMADWYKNGYIYKEAFTTNRSRYNELITQGNFGGFAYWYSLVSINSVALTALNPDAVYEYNRPILGPAGIAETKGSVGASGGLVPKYSKKADAVVTLVNWSCAEPENYITTELGIKGTHWKYVNEKNSVIEIIKEGYVGEFVNSLGTPNETLYSYDDPLRALHNTWLKSDLFKFEGTVGKTGWDIVYDTNKISKDVPEKTDIDRMITEEVVKFITGVNAMSKWDDFMKALKTAGIDKLTEAYTVQYNELKK